MNWDTIIRAKTILKREEVFITERGVNIIHFKVKQREGKWTDVWLTKGIWDCNAVTKKKDGTSWGCVMNVKADKTKPYCSHTLACKLYLEQKK